MPLLSTADAGTSEPAAVARLLAGHSPLSLFGIIRTPEGGQPTMGMEPGPWMRDDAGVLRPGALGILLDVKLSSLLFFTRPSTQAGVATSELSIDFVADAALAGGPLTAAARIVSRDESGGLVRGEVSNDGGIVAVATLAGRYLAMPSEYHAAPDVNRPAPDLSMAQIFAGLPHRTAEGAELSVQSSEWLANPRGVMHGGVLAVLIEYVAAEALDGGAGSWQPSSVRINYLRPSVLGEGVLVRAVRIQQGRQLALVRVETLRPDGKEVTIAHVSYTRKALPTTPVSTVDMELAKGAKQ